MLFFLFCDRVRLMGLLDKVLLTMKNFTADDPAIRRVIKNLEKRKERNLLKQMRIFMSNTTYEELLQKGYLKRRKNDNRKT